ncbi:MAG: hypothetical protein ACE5FN_01675 [Leptospirillia bacterium]
MEKPEATRLQEQPASGMPPSPEGSTGTASGQYYPTMWNNREVHFSRNPGGLMAGNPPGGSYPADFSAEGESKGPWINKKMQSFRYFMPKHPGTSGHLLRASSLQTARTVPV